MNKITEIIPDDLPEWMQKDIKDGQLFNRVLARMQMADILISGCVEFIENHPGMTGKDDGTIEWILDMHKKYLEAFSQ